MGFRDIIELRGVGLGLFWFESGYFGEDFEDVFGLSHSSLNKTFHAKCSKLAIH